MAKTPQRLFQRHSQFLGLLRSQLNRLHFHDKPSISLPAGGSISRSSAIRNSDPLSTTRYFYSRTGSFQIQSKSLTKPYQIPPIFSSRVGTRLYANSSGLRYFSSGGWKLGKAQTNANLPKSFFDLPLRSLRSAFYRYREAVGLQIEAFWKRNYVFLLAAGGVALCAVLWRLMFGIATTFVGLSEGMAKYGFLALSASMVAFSGLYIRSRLTINPDKVYRIAMRKLNTSAGILEVMGAPLTGTDLRAYVMSGGGFSLKKFKPKLRGKRCFLIFPIRGSERRGLVSVEVKKKKGEYDMKLLAVDIPMATGPDHRLFLIGDEEEYKVGGGLISELRDPVVKAMAATKEFEELDQIEEEEDAERELQEAERKQKEEIKKLETGALPE